MNECSKSMALLERYETDERNAVFRLSVQYIIRRRILQSLEKFPLGIS